MDKKFVEIQLTEKSVENMPCFNGCLRAQGSPTGK